MKSFNQTYQELLESVAEGIDLFKSILPKNYTLNDLKGAYKKLALANHPDRGGDLNKMKDVNLAYEQLSKRAHPDGSSSYGSVNQEPELSREEKLARNEKRHAYVKSTVEYYLKPELYEKYLESIFGVTFSSKIADNKINSWYVSDYISQWLFYDENNTKFFKIQLRADLNRQKSNVLGGGEGIFDFQIYISTDCVIDTKKIKINTWEINKQNIAELLKDPAKLFPADRVKKLTKSASKRKGMALRDSLSIIAHALGGNASSQSFGWQAEIPVAKYDYMYQGIANNTTPSTGNIKIALRRMTNKIGRSNGSGPLPARWDFFSFLFLGGKNLHLDINYSDLVFYEKAEIFEVLVKEIKAIQHKNYHIPLDGDMTQLIHDIKMAIAKVREAAKKYLEQESAKP